MLNETIFREYDIRGVADSDLSTEVSPILSKAIGTYLKRQGAKNVSVAYDARLSSTRLNNSFADGLTAVGLDVVQLGMVPTPLSYFSVFHLGLDASVMITGSHNPPQFNGFKIMSGKSTLHGSAIGEIKNIALAKDFESGTGKLSRHDIASDYIEHVVSNIVHPLNLKVVVDSGNGAGGPVATELYRRLGCEVIELYTEPDGRFPNHHPDPTELENIAELIATVKKSGARVGIGFDGDADRIGVVDPSGQAIFGDELLVIYAREVLKKEPGATIISEVKASHRLFQDIERHGGRPLMWKTGHSLIKAKMKEQNAILAGEMSGHVFFKDRYYGFDDAIYAGARLLEILHHTTKSPVELIDDLPPSFSTPEIRVACADELKFQVVEQAKEAFNELGLTVIDIDGARVEFDDGWGLVRASNTQPVLVYRFEATSPERLDEIQETIESTVARFLPK